MDKEWKKDVVDVKRVGDRIIALKLVVGMLQNPVVAIG